jgi:L-malate glycosyltransferase
MNKIAFVIFSDGFSGAEKVVWQSICYLRSELDIYLITNNEIVSFYSGLLEESKVLNVGNAFGYRKNTILSKLTENRFWVFQHRWFSKYNTSVNNFIQKNNIRIIHVHLDSSLFYIYKLLADQLKKGSISLLFTVHDTLAFSLENKSLANTFRKKNLIKIISKVNGIIFVSNYVYSIYCAFLNDNQQYKIIYNAVDLKSIKSYIKPIINRDYINFLYVGGQRYNKGFDILLEVFRNLIHNHNLRNIRLIILGQLPKNGIINKLVKLYAINEYVILEGYKKPPEHLNYINECHSLIMPSRSEALGIAAIEALAMNKFVIASNRGGLPEVIKDDINGSLCNLDVRDFENKIMKFINDYKKIGSRSISNDLLNKFNIETFKHELSYFYKTFF